ncbi:MAG: MMPL family transporter [Ferroplasma sp.]|uniref:MMPL family transporter n=1 Tax=Ferroplasma sp. TaxID=2591003 RepID=UPI002815A7CB|nr:MMPL family transporter [Ferroplasma sp.]WMT50555.1 MAG: MMPL family transporter [Ferroplasma sp.]
MDLSSKITKHRILVIAVWAIVIIALFPAFTGYSHFISYSTSSNAPSHSESEIAQGILDKKIPDNSSLIIVLQGNNPAALNSSTFATTVLSFQGNLSGLHLRNYSASDSVYSAYASFIDKSINSSNRLYINQTLDHYNGNATEASEYLNSTGYNITPAMILSVHSGYNPGLYYVTHYGTSGVPSFIYSEYSAKNITLVYLSFSVRAGKDVSSGKTASEIAFPAVNSLAKKDFGNAITTGNGAIAYETSQETAKAGFAFGLIFIFLAIAVLFAALSWKSSILVFIFSGIALLLGYVSEYITGLIFHHVSYIVNYTLTAVILGISADYLLFIISRYRDELRQGHGSEESLQTAIRKSGKSIVISGLTVAFSLFTFYFIPGFHSWGTTLFFAVIFTILLETVLLPAVISLFGKKLFMKLGMKPINPETRARSRFYRIADVSVKRKFMVIAVVLILGSLGIYSFFAVPTTYNFNTGLPQNLEAVKGLNAIDNSFGDSELYPVYVITDIQGMNNVNSTLHRDAEYLTSLNGVGDVIGPDANGKTVTNSTDISQYSIGSKYAYYTVYTDYSPYTDHAINLVKKIRSNSEFIVGGITSTVIDEKKQNNAIYGELELLIATVIAVIIGISFRSWKYPLISLTGVFFSVSWTTALLYFLSKYVLHEALIYLIPIILFIILFSLGSDYTVFIISRIREESATNERDAAIKNGIASSGKVVSALGIILAVSLGSLSLIPVAFLEQLGIAFIISLLIDTFIIRTVYFPAMISALFPHSKKS